MDRKYSEEMIVNEGMVDACAIMRRKTAVPSSSIESSSRSLGIRICKLPCQVSSLLPIHLRHTQLPRNTNSKTPDLNRSPRLAPLALNPARQSQPLRAPIPCWPCLSQTKTALLTLVPDPASISLPVMLKLKFDFVPTLIALEREDRPRNKTCIPQQ